jgi:glycosyltransferase involved in cell wall biosynthesis
MKIAQIAPLAEPVPPDGYGGTERVVASLVDELVLRGHEVTLFASGDSHTKAALVAATPRSLRRDPSRRDAGSTTWLGPHIAELGMAFGRADDFDVIHSHVDVLAFPIARLSPTPTVHTIHGRLDVPDVAPVFAEFTELPLVSISEAQREPVRDLGLHWVATVHHGVKLEEYPYSPRPGPYLAFVSRLSEEKRPDLAIAVATRAGIPLKIAGKVDDNDREYFERVLRPLLRHPLVEFLGEIDETTKREVMAGALALLFPIEWLEPFGLVMIEAMAAGTPVIARPRGAVPEIVLPGRTGFVAETVDELVEAVRRVETIDRAACRADVEARFSVRRMVDDYEAVYRRTVSQTARVTPLRHTA